MRLACWFRGLAETIFSLNSFRSDKYRSIGKVRDREDALASTRDACATPRNPPLIPFCPPCREYAKIFRRLAHRAAVVLDVRWRVPSLRSRIRRTSGQRKKKASKYSAGPFASRRPDDDGQENRNRHYPRDDMERSAVISGGLTHARDVKRSENAGKTPRRQHEPIDRPDVFRSKIIRRERWHGAKSSAVTHQDDKGHRRHHRRHRDFWEKPKQQDLRNKHDPKCRPPCDEIGQPGPKHAADSVAETGDSDHSAGRQGAHAGEFLKNRRFL